jgi:lantibiotic modifying enzyme
MKTCLTLAMIGVMTAWGAVAQNSAEYLNHALQAEKFIDSMKVDGEHGIMWKTSPESGDVGNHSFYHGSAGIALYYLELHEATGKKHFLDTALDAGEELIAASLRNDVNTIGMYSGLPAEAFVLNELYARTKDARFLEAARHATGRIKARSVKLGSGVSWIEQNPFAAYSPANVNIGEMYDLTIGAAGVGEFFLYAQRTGLDDAGVDWATKIGDRLIEVAEKTEDGLRWPMMDNLPSPYIMPNFSHGPAGIGYFLADLYTETKEQKYLDAALSATAYIRSREVKKGDGILVPHHELRDDNELFYFGTCHGPAGTGRLMYLLHEITGEEKWMEWIDANLRGADAMGVPETRSPGLWNNTSQCCGDAGLGEYALYLYRATGKQSYRDYADRIAKYILSQATSEEGKLSWTQAEMRIRPEYTQTQTGYMQGAAGMGSFFLHLATVDNDPVKIPLLATPFDE